MNTLIIVAHPNPASFNKSGILETVKATLTEQGHEYRVRDLYEINFNPILSGADFAAFQSGTIPADIQAEQDHIRWAKKIVVIYPIWWIGRPAIFQGYIDRVFSYGFAFEYGEAGAKGLLDIDKTLIINTAGTPEHVYDGWNESKQLLGRPSVEGIFYFSGVKQVEHLQFYGLPSSTPEQREEMLAKVKSSVASL
jgi:NAD(P)H dehydrogenase (quinone)